MTLPVAVILARGGSKRLPGKSLRLLCGRPLIAYTIEAAQQAERLSRTIVSTDNLDIARVAAELGAEVPFLRPPEFAGDTSSPVEALRHAAAWLQGAETNFDTMVALQITSPMRRGPHIDGAIDLFDATASDTVTAVSAAAVHPYWHWQPDGGVIKPFFSPTHVAMSRHELPPALTENGAVYVFRRAVLDNGSIYGDRIAGYLMSESESVDIDTLEDFEYAEFLMSHRPR